MKDLKKILKGVKLSRHLGDIRESITSISFDSRTVGEKGLFVAVRGTIVDGHDYIGKAIDHGASVIVCEQIPDEVRNDIVYLEVENSARALATLASNFYENPSRKLKLVGITGTNGKTTTATLLYRLFREAGYKAGLLSTIQNHINDKVVSTSHTTLDVVSINRLLAEMVNEGCDYCFMEVSSHAIVQERVAGLSFAGGVFTNITHDHLDYHKTFREYLLAKKLFFDRLPAQAFALVNMDDKNGSIMLQNTNAQKYTYSLKTVSDYKCKIIEIHFDGTLLDINGREVWSHLVGEFNAYNMLAVFAVGVLLEQETETVLTILSKLREVNGRFECIRSNEGVMAIVDYAHTPDALKNVLDTINRLRKGNEQLITVVGAGGDRDKSKRPLMAGICAENSNKVILTSDNPRSEDPDAIIQEMVKGIEPQYARNVITITDRKQAIKTACLMAKRGDIILVAGKGHETYQEVRGVRTHFDDREILREQFAMIDIIDKSIKN